LSGVIRCAFVAFVLTLLTGCHSGQVRLQLAPGTSRYVWHDLITPGQWRDLYQALTYEVKAPLGYARGRGQEAEGSIVNAQLRWNDAVSPLGGLFEDLLNDHNKALITFSEFQKRKGQLTDAAASLTGLRVQLDSAIADYRSAKQLETQNRGAEGQKADEAIAQARQQMAAASQKIDHIIQQAGALMDALKGPRAEGKVMAAQ
jgi:predicted ATP-dependent endonuclease of OLD family